MWVIYLDLLQTLKSFQGVKDFEETTSFYYTFHNCPEKGEHTKVMLDYTLSVETGDIENRGLSPLWKRFLPQRFPN